MTVRVLTTRRFRWRSKVRRLEWVFLLFGLVALDIYIWVNAGAALYQAYDNWSFERRPRQAAKPVPLAPGNVRTAPLDQPASRPSIPTGLIGRLTIPSLSLSVMVREGADASTLRRAVGHIPGTALPGQVGNVGLAGHRDTFFRPLRNIRKSDSIELETQNGTFQYTVVSARIVSPRDTHVLAPSEAETLTLVTCYPFYYVGSAPNRFVVRAVLIPPMARLKARGD